MKRILLSTLALLAVLSILAQAEVPSLINFRERLFNTNGAPVNATVNTAITIYDEEGSPRYHETIGRVQIQNGLCTFKYGSMGRLLNSVLQTSRECWLELEINGHPLAPCHRLISVVPNAAEAERTVTVRDTIGPWVVSLPGDDQTVRLGLDEADRTFEYYTAPHNGSVVGIWAMGKYAPTSGVAIFTATINSNATALSTSMTAVNSNGVSLSTATHNAIPFKAGDILGVSLTLTNNYRQTSLGGFASARLIVSY
jgi:hypothetical protein